MANEIVLVDKWLAGLLGNDVALAEMVNARIFSYLAPAGTIFPFVLYAYQGSSDVIAVGGYRILNSGVYQVKGVVKGDSMVAAEAIANRIDMLLTRATGTVVGGIVLACVRERPIAYPEISDGLRYNHLGGLYRIQVQGA